MRGLEQVVGLLPGETISLDAFSVEGKNVFASAFGVDQCAALAVGAAALAARSFRGGGPPVVLKRAHLAADFGLHLAIDGKRPEAWADLSGYYATADGRHVQLHCNFAHHRAGVVEHLGFAAAGNGLVGRDTVAAEIARRNSDELEDELMQRGMIAAKLRTLEEWDRHPHAAQTRGLPLISFERIGDAEPRDLAGRDRRVLDCSRVLAGPVAGRTLAAVGWDVLRLGAAHLPAVELCVAATGFGKRNCHADLRTAPGQEQFGGLLGTSDFWIDGFRPGALESFGWTPKRAAELNPGICVVQLDAFDGSDVWPGRRGFDSIVQSTTGLVLEGQRRSGSARPEPLPVQALDYATGYLAAFAALGLAVHQAKVGGSWLAKLSLLRTRNWLMGLQVPQDFVASKPRIDPRYLGTWDSDFGRVTAALPLIGNFRTGPRGLGTSAATWRDRGSWCREQRTSV